MQPLRCLLFFFRLSRWLSSFYRSTFSLSFVFSISVLWCTYILASHSDFYDSLSRLDFSKVLVAMKASSYEF
jgi:hypothetical protein